jgi:hypothetical protein
MINPSSFEAVVAENATTAAGKTHQVEYYNLDVILSVGDRVNPKRGTQFRPELFPAATACSL